MAAAQHSTPLPLLLSLTALIPPASHTKATQRASLISTHTEPFHLTQAFFTAEREAIPLPGGRHLRAQAYGKNSYRLQVLSRPIQGRGSEETRVQSCAVLDVLGVGGWRELEAFLVDLGFSKTGMTQSQGMRYFLGPSITLTITQSSDAGREEPYVAELATVDPLPAHLPLEATVNAMESIRERFRGLLEFSRGPE